MAERFLENFPPSGVVLQRSREDLSRSIENENIDLLTNVVFARKHVESVEQ